MYIETKNTTATAANKEKGYNIMIEINEVRVLDYANIELEGSSKQVAWAKQLRNEAAGMLFGYAFTGQKDLTNDDLVEWYEMYANKSKAELEELIASEADDIDYTVAYINAMAARASVANEILTNKSAAYWINNKCNEKLVNVEGKAMHKETDRAEWTKRIDKAGELPA